MAKPQRDSKDRAEDRDTVEDASAPGALARLRAAVSRRVVRQIDRADGFLLRQRSKLVPAEDGAEDEDDKRPDKKRGKVQKVFAPEPAAAGIPARRGSVLAFLLGVTTLLIGVIAGAVFSFNLFARKIESQGDFIANQADEVYEYQKETRKAERALDKVKDELKETRQQVEEMQAELDKAKARLADIDGRAMIYGGGRVPADPQAPGSLASRPVAGKRGSQVPNRSCNLKAGSAQSDMSKCLSLAR